MNARSVYLNVVSFFTWLILFVGSIYFTLVMIDYIWFKMHDGIKNYNGFSETNESVYLNKLFKATGILIVPLIVQIISQTIIHRENDLRYHSYRYVFMYVMRLLTFVVAMYTGIYVWNQGMIFINFDFLYFYSSESDYAPLVKTTSVFIIALIYYLSTFKFNELNGSSEMIKTRVIFQMTVKVFTLISLLIGVIILFTIFVDFVEIEQKHFIFNRNVLYELILKSGWLVIPLSTKIFILFQERRVWIVNRKS